VSWDVFDACGSCDAFVSCRHVDGCLAVVELCGCGVVASFCYEVCFAVFELFSFQAAFGVVGDGVCLFFWLWVWYCFFLAAGE